MKEADLRVEVIKSGPFLRAVTEAGANWMTENVGPRVLAVGQGDLIREGLDEVLVQANKAGLVVAGDYGAQIERHRQRTRMHLREVAYAELAAQIKEKVRQMPSKLLGLPGAEGATVQDLERLEAILLSLEMTEALIDDKPLRPVGAIEAKSQAIGDFLRWLEDGDLGEGYGSVELAYRPLYGRKGDMRRSDDLQPLIISKTEILALYFGIDLGKIETEKRAMLEEFRRLEDVPRETETRDGGIGGRCEGRPGKTVADGDKP